jgi:hydroxypyruvate reductase
LGDPRWETPKPGDPEFANDRVHLIATAATALAAAARFLERQGYRVMQIGDDLDDEAQALGCEHARLAKEMRKSGVRTAILSGGETRVALGDEGGRGGRNTEYLAALALELDDAPGISALAADTDGIDGHGDHAGGIVVPGMLARGARHGVSLAELLARHDTYSYFDACELLLKTGPTRTNVNDFRLILCDP